MHEHGVTERILEVALEQAKAHGGRRITDVYLTVGELSEISDESIRFYWTQVSHGTLGEHAELHFEHAPTDLICWGCGFVYRVNAETMMCPSCFLGTDRQAMLHDIKLTAIDVEDEGASSATREQDGAAASTSSVASSGGEAAPV
jgi:hydrogenase nickel incorporation protein HypA/HybF